MKNFKVIIYLILFLICTFCSMMFIAYSVHTPMPVLARLSSYTVAILMFMLPIIFALKDTLFYSFRNNGDQHYPKSPGVEMILEERREQILLHGHTRESDKRHVEGELVGMAKFVLTGEYVKHWPERCSHDLAVKLKNKNRKEQLITAGALIAAELDRTYKDE